ncbi:MAG: tetratricopeptide repeat protein [Proteobacteria bacterium]|nr:tetratricopeptide repeat protein [Pseudomonadota bacterium]MCP4917180.1 tetratricopeptide repeat protein [Pseudomonadota bacterium]
MLARIHLENGDLDQAAAAYKLAILHDPTAARLYLELAQVRAQQGEPDLARSYLEEAAQLGSTEAAALLAASTLPAETGP